MRRSPCVHHRRLNSGRVIVVGMGRMVRNPGWEDIFIPSKYKKDLRIGWDPGRPGGFDD